MLLVVTEVYRQQLWLYENKKQSRYNQVERFIPKKVIAIAVSEV